MASNKSFMQVPNALADALIRSGLSAGQWRVFLWTLRHTLGWNRDSTTFTWYRVAKETRMNRSSALRAARLLMEGCLLSMKDGRLVAETDPARWCQAVHSGTRAPAHRKRCTDAPLFRRAIDMFNDVKKKERNTSKKERAPVYHPAGAARPASGKYAHLSED